jgi:UDP-glucuronate decarboxylase
MLSKQIKNDIEKEIIPEFRDYLKSLAGKTILITGGNGFLPSYLVDTFSIINKDSDKKIKLIIINKNQVNKDSRLGHLLGDKNVTFIAADAGKKFDIPFHPDIIIHAASRANPTSFLEDPMDTIDANVNGIRYLLDYAKDHPVEQFIFFSSGEIYGNPVAEFVPTPEIYSGNVDCLGKYACYIESKRFAETLAITYFRQYKVPVKFLRIILAYGPGMRNDGKVVSDFFDSAIKNKEIKIRDRGEARRSFCYASDAARQIFYVMFKGQNGEAYNIGDDTNNVSIKELADMVSDVLGNGTIVNPNMSVTPKQIYGVDTRFLDISKVKALGFKITVGLKEGLNRLKKHLEEYNYKWF